MRSKGAGLVGGKLATLVFGHGHELLDGKVFSGAFAFDGLGNGMGDVGKLEKRRGFWWNGLQYALGRSVGAEERWHRAVGEADGNKGFIHSEGEGCDLVLLCSSRQS